MVTLSLVISLVTLALEPPSSDYAPQKVPFAFADFSWVPGNGGGPLRPFSFGPFTGELRVDTVYHHSFAEPRRRSRSTRAASGAT